MGTLEIVFLVLLGVFGPLYWLNYRKDENLPVALLKVAALLGFVYAVMKGFDWMAAEVPAEEVMTFGEPATEAGPRIPLAANAFTWFAVFILVMITWYARDKFTTVVSLMLSTWDRGNWYVLPVLVVLMTIGLALAAAAASPVLSPFIYTLF